MADKTEERLLKLEQSLKSLQEKSKAQEHEIERLQAVNQIQNTMGYYEVIHNQTGITKSWQIFAQHSPDTWLEVSNWGRVEGIEEIKKFWEAQDWSEDMPPTGAMFSHHLTTPIIEVAKDGKTAKAIWFSPGHETKPRDGKLTAHWVWGKYAIDWTKEDGKWKIWHFKWFRTFITPFDVNWVDRPREHEMGYAGPPRRFKSTASAFHRPYFPDVVQICVPPSPRPYDSWTDSEKEWHLKPDEYLRD